MDSKDIKYLVIHCSATPEGREYSREQIKQMHLERNFKDIGYHYLIHLDGSISKGRADNVPGAHVKGYNDKSLGICYIGGVASDGKTPKDTRNIAQKDALVNLLMKLKRKYPLAKIVGHRDLSPDLNHNGIIESNEWLKSCPSFDAINEYKGI